MQKNFIFLIFIHYFFRNFIVISLFSSEFLSFSASFLKEVIYKPSFFLPFSLKTPIFVTLYEIFLSKIVVFPILFIDYEKTI